MNSAQTIANLKSFEPELRAQGVSALYLFGSYARGEETVESDIDLLFDLAPDVRFSLFDQARISTQLSEWLHAKVDCIPRRALHSILKERVEAEKVTVFN
jgi:uncharacterized protein